MANIKSQIKRNRQNEKRRLRNRIARGNARTAIKKAHTTIEAGQAEESKASVLLAISALDKAARRGVLHRNNVARRKARLVKYLAAMKPVEVKKVEQPQEEAMVEPEAETKPVKKAAPRKRATTTTKAAAEKAEAKPKKAVTTKKTATTKKTTPAKKTTTTKKKAD